MKTKETPIHHYNNYNHAIILTVLKEKWLCPINDYTIQLFSLVFHYCNYNNHSTFILMTVVLKELYPISNAPIKFNFKMFFLRSKKQQ